MRITYVLARPELGGGTKVVFQHAALLAGRGHRVTVVGEGPAPGWLEVTVPYVDRTAEAPRLGEQDLVIATFWTTLAVARALGVGPVAHFCQGYEGGLTHLAPHLDEIEEVYRQPVPTLVVSAHLADLLAERFGRSSRVTPPPLDPRFRPRRRFAPAHPARVVLPGIFAAEVKGVPTGLEAVRSLRRRGLDVRLLRISVLPLGEEEEAILSADERLCGVTPAEVAAALRDADLLLFPSRREEGFGLPVLEAFASKVPVVASDIPSVRDFAAGGAELVPAGDAEAFAATAHGLLTSSRRWRAARRAGHRTARRFRPRAVASRLEVALRWAAESGRHAR